MLVYPDFFKVACLVSGNHENNIYNNTWSEKHHGVKEVRQGRQGHFEYDIEKNSELAKNLKGHLMLVTGDIDNNVHPANTYRMADALIKANKRFDMFIFPGSGTATATRAYFFWIRADYFCQHLLGQAADSVDIVELNKEKEQTGEKRRPYESAEPYAACPFRTAACRSDTDPFQRSRLIRRERLRNTTCAEGRRTATQHWTEGTWTRTLKSVRRL